MSEPENPKDDLEKYYRDRQKAMDEYWQREAQPPDDNEGGCTLGLFLVVIFAVLIPLSIYTLKRLLP
jgi:hypothetical protein